MKIDLFKLHSETDRPKGWIWASLKNSRKIKRKLLDLLKLIIGERIFIKYANNKYR